MTAPVATGPDTRTGGARRDPKLEGLRGYLAIGVLVYHVAFYSGITSVPGTPTHGIWTVLTDGLSVCLPPFFVLSAFFLYRPFARSILSGAKHPPARQFFRRRALRLLPGYWLLVIVTLLTIDLYNINGFWYVARPFLLIHFYWPGIPWVAGLVPTWTVPAELIFYAILPVIAVLIGRYARKAVDPKAMARRMTIPLSLFFVVGFAWTVYTNLPSAQNTAMFFNMWYWPFGYYDAFAVGMVLATVSAYAQVTGKTPALHRFILRWPNLFWLGALAVFVIDLNRFFGAEGAGDWGAFTQELVIHALVLIFSWLLIAPLTVPGVRSRLMQVVLTIWPIRYIGRVSYGIYLWHMAFVTLFLGQGNIFGNAPGPGPELRGAAHFWPMTFESLAASIVAASISYYLLEQPILRWQARRDQARKDKASAEPALAPVPPGPPGQPAPTPTPQHDAA